MYSRECVNMGLLQMRKTKDCPVDELFGVVLAKERHSGKDFSNT